MAARRSSTPAALETRPHSRSKNSELLFGGKLACYGYYYLNLLTCFQVPTGSRPPQQQQSDHPWVWRGNGAPRLLGGAGEERQEGLWLHAARYQTHFICVSNLYNIYLYSCSVSNTVILPTVEEFLWFKQFVHLFVSRNTRKVPGFCYLSFDGGIQSPPAVVDRMRRFFVFWHDILYLKVAKESEVIKTFICIFFS